MPIEGYYSQFGEDAVLWSLFGEDGDPGFFVDVGALDGTRFSNTYGFELAGWTGVCVEAHPDYIELLRRNRPRSTVIHAAVSDCDGDDVPFYAHDRGSLSTLDPTKEEWFRREFADYFSGFRVKQVPMRTLDTVLMRVVPPEPIDFISIDVEGTEMAVLRGFDLSRYRPRVVLAEAAFPGERDEMDGYMQRAGYVPARVLGPNRFYCRERQDAQRVAEASVNVPLCHTPHPLDCGAFKTGGSHRSTVTSVTC